MGDCVLAKDKFNYNKYSDGDEELSGYTGIGLLEADDINMQGAWLEGGAWIRRRGGTVATFTFPEPSGINVNMMPIRLGMKESLPEYLHSYWPLLEACKIAPSDVGKVGYLTVQENHVEKGETQRRPGLHVEV